MKRTVVLVTLIATLFAACGDDGSDITPAEPASIAQALETEGEIVVTGHLFVLDGGDVVLAELVAESFPPQPGGATISVVGLDLDTLDLEQALAGSELATTKWSAGSITLIGSMVSGVLEEAELSPGSAGQATSRVGTAGADPQAQAPRGDSLEG